MSHWNPATERNRAAATVTYCELQLRRAHEDARRAGETFRRAMRGIEEAEAALGHDTRRLDRMSTSMSRRS